MAPVCLEADGKMATMLNAEDHVHSFVSGKRRFGQLSTAGIEAKKKCLVPKCTQKANNLANGKGSTEHYPNKVNARRSTVLIGSVQMDL